MKTPWLALVLLCYSPQLTAQHVIATIPIPGIDMQIPLAVNPLTSRVYALSDETSLDVIDTVSNTVVRVIPVGGYPAGVAVNPRTNLIYIPIFNYTLNVIDGKTNTIVYKITVPNDPHSPAVNPVTNRIYLVQDFTLTVIDGGSNNVIDSITGFAGIPIVAVVNSETNQVYVTYQSPTDGGYAVIDGATNTITDQVSVAGLAGNLPLLNSIAADVVGRRIYFGDENNFDVFVLDLKTNVVSKLDLSHTVQGVAAIPGTDTLMACRSGGVSVSVVDVGTGKTIRVVKVGTLPHALVYDPVNKRGYVANLGDRTVSVLGR